MRLYSRLFIVILLVLLSACSTPAAQLTPTLQGPIVPTRGTPPTSIAAVGDATVIAAMATASAVNMTIDTTTLTPDGGTAQINVGDATNTVEATATVEPTEEVTEIATEEATSTPTETPSPTASESPTVTPTTEAASATPTTAVAAGPIALNYGDRVEGVISNEVPEVLYTFEGSAGDLVTISMTETEGDLDTYLLLMSPNGEKVTENDDLASDNRNSLITAFQLPTDGTYTIVATRYQRQAGTTTGSYELTLGTGVPDTRTMVMLDETIEGTIEDGQFTVAYRFDGQENQVVNIAVTSSDDLNPVVILLAPDGHEYARNDDESRRETDALIEGVRLPATGSYGIIVTRYQQAFGTTEGDFELEVTEAEAADSPLTVLSRNLEYDATEEGGIGDDLPYYSIFTFAGRGGDVVSIQMSRASGNLDTLVILTDANGNEILRNDDDLLRNNSTNSAIRDAVLPRDGFYTIITTRFGESIGTSTGEFEIELTLEASADDSTRRVLYAPVNPLNSGSIREDGTGYINYLAGDYLSDSNREVEVATVLTFALPTIDEGVEWQYIELDLTICREVGDGFDELGDMSIYTESFRNVQGADVEPSSDAEEIDSIGDCEPVEVTDEVSAAYESGDGIIQIRLVFEDIDSNDDADYVLFDPRLVLVVAE